MKYEVPEINISKFSVENIVTLSAATNAGDAINTAIANGAITGTNSNIKMVKTNMEDWVAKQ